MAVMDGLENSEDEIEFSEYKHAVVLKTQLCIAVLHLVTVMQPVHCKEAILSVPEEKLCKTLAEFLKRKVVLPEGNESTPRYCLICTCVILQCWRRHRPT